MDISLAGFNSVNELAKQLITLAIGILALSITFIKDVLKHSVPVVTWPLKFAWISYLLSVCFGIWTMMAVTGTIFDVTEHPDKNKPMTYGMNISIPASLQILAFVLGTSLLIAYGAKILRIRSEQTEPPNNTEQ